MSPATASVSGSSPWHTPGKDGPDAGRMTFGGLEVGSDDHRIKETMGVVFQNSLLDPMLSVEENLILRATFSGVAAQRVRDLAGLAALGSCVDHRSSGRFKEFRGSPIRRWQLILGHQLSAVIVAVLISMVILAIGTVFIWAMYGHLMPPVNLLQATGLIVLPSLAFASMSSFLLTFVATQGGLADRATDPMTIPGAGSRRWRVVPSPVRRFRRWMLGTRLPADSARPSLIGSCRHCVATDNSRIRGRDGADREG